MNTTPSMSIGDLLTPVELAKQLKIDQTDLKRLRYRHGLPYISLVGGDVRFDPAAIREWLVSRATRTKK